VPVNHLEEIKNKNSWTWEWKPACTQDWLKQLLSATPKAKENIQVWLLGLVSAA